MLQHHTPLKHSADIMGRDRKKERDKCGRSLWMAEGYQYLRARWNPEQSATVRLKKRNRRYSILILRFLGTRASQ